MMRPGVISVEFTNLPYPKHSAGRMLQIRENRVFGARGWHYRYQPSRISSHLAYNSVLGSMAIVGGFFGLEL